MKAKEFINGNKQIASEKELQFSISSVNESVSGSGSSTDGTTDPDVPLPPKK